MAIIQILIGFLHIKMKIHYFFKKVVYGIAQIFLPKIYSLILENLLFFFEFVDFLPPTQKTIVTLINQVNKRHTQQNR